MSILQINDVLMNSLILLREIIDSLNDNSIPTVVFGGWAEELAGIIESREHKDIDLLYEAGNFNLVDKLFLNSHELKEICQKHFHHKRAFLFKEVMVEIFLVENDLYGDFTNFWGKTKHYWPQPFAINKKGLNIATPRVLNSYRENYDKLKYLK